MRKGLLIAPEFPSDSFWSYKYIIHYVNRKAAFPPLGLLSFASLMPSGWDFELVDLNVQHPNQQTLRQKIDEADAVFIGAMSIQKKSIIDFLTGAAKGSVTPIVLGGPLASTYRNHIMEPDNPSDQILHEGLDIIVWGEAQNTIGQIIQHIEENPKHQNTTPHLIIPETVKHAEPGSRKYLNDKSIFTPLEKQIPRWDLLEVENYRALMIQTTAGCKFRCDFCDIVQFNGGFPRVKTSEQIYDELKAIYDTGHRGSVFVVDDNIMGIVDELNIILDTQIRFQRDFDYPFTFFVQSSVDIAKDSNDYLIEKFRLAGYNAMFFGIENPNDEALKMMNKKQNNRVNLKELVGKFQQAGIEVYAGFIFGADSDTPTTANQIVNFIKETSIFSAMTGLLTPMPHTPLYQRLKSENRLVEAEFSGNNSDDEIQYVPKNMSTEELRAGMHYILKSLFHPKEVYRRALSSIQKTKPNFFKRERFNVEYIKAALLSVLYQGIGRFDFHYFKFLYDAVKLDRKYLSELKNKMRDIQKKFKRLKSKEYNPGEFNDVLNYAKEYMVRYQRKMNLEQIQSTVNDWKEKLNQKRITTEDMQLMYENAKGYLQKQRRLFTYPGFHLSNAFELAIKGFHYEQVMRKITSKT